MVNLIVELDEARFGAAALTAARSAIEGAGFAITRETPGSDAYLAWIDDEFGGTWSSEAFAGSSVIASKDGSPAGFAAYDPQGLRFLWLRGLGAQPGVGIFGPFGVARAHRKSGIGPHLLVAALASLRERGYTRALIPAVGAQKLIDYYRVNSGAEIAETFARAQWMERRYRTIVLASGNGTNFQAVIDRVAQAKLPLDLAMLVTNNAQAYALERARAAGIPHVALPWDRKSQARAQYDDALFELVRRERPELLLLLGWMHVLREDFIAAFPGTINIHPAFLPLDQRRDDVVFPDGTGTPAFRGAHAVEDALALQCQWAGASSHEVCAEADRGRVLVRRPLFVGEGADFAGVMERLHVLEHEVLAGGIMRWVFER